MKIKTLCLSATAIVGLALASPSIAAERIVNGSFGNGLAAWTVMPAPYSDLAVITGQAYVPYGGTGSASALSNPFASFGSGDVQNVSTLSQTFNTVAGATYFLSFNAGAFGPSGQQQTFSYSFTGFAPIFATVANNNNFDTTFQTFTQSFVATGGPTTLSFTLAGQPTASQDGFLDSISLTGAVPEPATWAMMLMGFGMIGAGVRSRRRSSVRITYA